jgi:hypothetical protein
LRSDPPWRASLAAETDDLHVSFEWLRQLLRFIVRSAPTIEQVAVPPAQSSQPHIDFVGFGEDYLVSGRVSLDGGRLSDLINHSAALAIENAYVEGLDQGQGFEVRVARLAGRTLPGARHRPTR